MEKIVDVNCLEHIYPDKTKVELCGLEFTVKKGEKVAVLGSNGAGKTTLLKHILGLLKPSQGEVKVFGLNPHDDFEKIQRRIGIVFQSVESQLIGPTVLEDVMFSPLNYGDTQEVAYEKAKKIMEKLNIWELKDKVIHYLSGGEKRKVALAGALVQEPELMLLDEPFTGLDKKSIRELIHLINTFNEEHSVSWIISTHDVELVADFADVMYLISNRLISQKGGLREILTNTEELSKYNVEPPAVVNLLNKLNVEINENFPITVDECADFLRNKII